MPNPLSKRNQVLAFLSATGFCTFFMFTGCQLGGVRSSDLRTPASNRTSAEGALNSSHVGTCTVCLQNVSKKEIAEHKAYVCSQGDCLDRDCMWDQIKSISNVRVLEIEGLSCGGRIEGKDQHCGDACKEKIPLAMIRELLTEDKRVELDQRLAESKKKLRE